MNESFNPMTRLRSLNTPFSLNGRASDEHKGSFVEKLFFRLFKLRKNQKEVGDKQQTLKNVN
jgi:hypothetical protein